MLRAAALLFVCAVVIVIGVSFPTMPIYAPLGFSVFGFDSEGVKHEILLKGVKQDSHVTMISDFAIQPSSVLKMKHGDVLVLDTSDGPDRIERVLITNVFDSTGDLTKVGGVWPLEGIEEGMYLLDLIVNLPEGSPNGQRGIYETVMLIGPGDVTEAILTMENSGPTLSKLKSIDDDSGDFRGDEDDEEPSICYFDQSQPECQPDADGNCPNGWPLNENGQCHPGGKCPAGFERVDDDETGTCYKNTFHCQGSNAIVLDEDDCAIYEPPEQAAQSDSNCGGVPCTASDKEDSWLSDSDEEPIQIQNDLEEGEPLHTGQPLIDMKEKSED
jgi:hypothetical protein